MKLLGNVLIRLLKNVLTYIRNAIKERKELNQLSKKELVKLILGQQGIIEQLKIEIEKLKVSP